MTTKKIYAPESKKYKVTDLSEPLPEQIEPASHRRALQTYDLKQQFLYPIERLTQDKTVVRNIKFPGADEAYPDVTEALYRFVSKFYPNAKCGPLWVDEPKNEREVYRAYERHKVMKKLKLKHVILEKDTTFEHLLEQLGESL